MKNMQFYGYHGIFTAEKEMGQIIEVDVELVCDLAAAAKNDDPEMAFNPVDIYTVCKDIVEGKDFNLLKLSLKRLQQSCTVCMTSKRCE